MVAHEIKNFGLQQNNFKCKQNFQNSSILYDNDAIISDVASVAEVFNGYFTGIADGIGLKIPYPW